MVRRPAKPTRHNTPRKCLCCCRMPVAGDFYEDGEPLDQKRHVCLECVPRMASMDAEEENRIRSAEEERERIREEEFARRESELHLWLSQDEEQD